MSAPDIFALGGRQDDGDAEILALFRQWCAAWRDSASSRCDDDDELSAAVDIAYALAERIYDAPVRGVVGLAIKAYMVAEVGKGENGIKFDCVDPCVIGPIDENCYSSRCVEGQRTDVAHIYNSPHALRGLLASAAAFVPELRPLVAKAVESPLTLPLDDGTAS